MADLPMAQIPNFQLGGPQVPYMGGVAQGLNAGINQGVDNYSKLMGVQQQQQQIQGLASLRAVEAQKAAIEAHKAQIDSALTFIGKIGDQLKYYRPNTQKQAIANGLNALAKVAPEFGLQTKDPAAIPDEAIDLMQNFGKLRQGHLDGKISDADFQKESQNLLTQMSEFERSMLKDQESIIGEPTYQPGQIGTNPESPTGAFNTKTGQVINPSGASGPFIPAGAAFTQSQESQRTAATISGPYHTVLKSYNTAIAALGRKDQLGDRTALLEAGKVLNNGQAMPVAELQELAKSGALGDRIAQGFSNIVGTGSLTDGQRQDLQQVLELHAKGSYSATQGQVQMLPVAKAPPPPSNPKIQAAQKWLKDHPNDPLAKQVQAKLDAMK